MYTQGGNGKGSMAANITGPEISGSHFAGASPVRVKKRGQEIWPGSGSNWCHWNPPLPSSVLPPSCPGAPPFLTSPTPFHLSPATSHWQHSFTFSASGSQLWKQISGAMAVSKWPLLVHYAHYHRAVYNSGNVVNPVLYKWPVLLLEGCN